MFLKVIKKFISFLPKIVFMNYIFLGLQFHWLSYNSNTVLFVFIYRLS